MYFYSLYSVRVATVYRSQGEAHVILLLFVQHPLLGTGEANNVLQTPVQTVSSLQSSVPTLESFLLAILLVSLSLGWKRESLGWGPADLTLGPWEGGGGLSVLTTWRAEGGPV